jgi:hypothetical protein
VTALSKKVVPLSTSPSPLEDALLTPAEVADYLHITPGTLAVWRCTRRYPLAFVRVGSKIFYRASAVAAFVAAREEGGAR